MLHLLTEDDVEVVVHGAKIIARLLVVHGSGYTSKFSSKKTGGYVIMRHHLRRWWDVPTLWPICFSVLFGRDVADIDLERPFELFSLLDSFDKCKLVNPGILPVLLGMMQHGLKEVFRFQDDPESPLHGHGPGFEPVPRNTGGNEQPRSRSMSLAAELESRRECSFLYLCLVGLTISRSRTTAESTLDWTSGHLAHYCAISGRCSQ